MNLSMVGNLTATLMVGMAVWLGMQWRPNPNDDYTSMLAIALAFSGGVLTALSSQVTIKIQKEGERPESERQKTPGPLLKEKTTDQV